MRGRDGDGGFKGIILCFRLIQETFIFNSHLQLHFQLRETVKIFGFFLKLRFFKDFLNISLILAGGNYVESEEQRSCNLQKGAHCPVLRINEQSAGSIARP
jgi:hypothetical protein